MPMTLAQRMKSKISCAPRRFDERKADTPEEAHALHYSMPEATKTVGHANIRDGHTHTRHLTNQRESDHIKQPGFPANATTGKMIAGFRTELATRFQV